MPRASISIRLSASAKSVFPALLIGCLLVAAMVNLVEATPLPQPNGDGQSTFQQKCAACHTIGGGPTLGPDLKGVTATQDRNWLLAFTLTPDKLIAQKDPRAMQLLQEFKNIPMPNLGLTEADANAVLDYLTAQSGGAPATGSTPGQTSPQPSQPQTTGSTQTQPSPQPSKPQPLGAGNADSGRALFTGASAFKNGGPPCIACHAVSGDGALGGGALGPDLTQAFAKFGGDAGLGPVFASLPFPTMKPFYDSRPLTPEEQADLKAFLQASATGQPGQPTLLLAVLAVGGMALLLVIAQLVWHKRVNSVRKSLVGRP